VVSRAISELESYAPEIPRLSVWVSEGLFVPLLAKGRLQLGDFQWFKEEEKDELYDVRGHF